MGQFFVVFFMIVSTKVSLKFGEAVAVLFFVLYCVVFLQKSNKNKEQDIFFCQENLFPIIILMSLNLKGTHCSFLCQICYQHSKIILSCQKAMIMESKAYLKSEGIHLKVGP